jgi:hypothetical protein
VAVDKLLHDLLDVWDHIDLDFTKDGKVEGHAEVVNISSTQFHFIGAVVKESFVGALQPIGHLSNDMCPGMADFQMVNVPNDGKLFIFNDLVGDARIVRIVRIGFETNLLQVSDKALVVQESGLHDTVESIEKADVQDSLAFGADDDILGIDFRCHFHDELCLRHLQDASGQMRWECRLLPRRVLRGRR